MKAHKTAAELLKCAKNIAKRGWCQGAYARTKGGRETTVDSKSAAKFCMIGSLERCSGGLSGPRYKAAYRLLSRVCPSGAIATFNDAPGRKKQEVLVKYDEAIKLAKSKTPA